jgi:hypothetical protein
MDQTEREAELECHWARAERCDEVMLGAPKSRGEPHRPVCWRVASGFPIVAAAGISHARTRFAPGVVGSNGTSAEYEPET